MPYALALALTLTVEVPVYSGALRAARLGRSGRVVALAVAVNLVTHPLVWLALRDAGPPDYWARFAVVEAAAWLIEWALFLLSALREARLLALVAFVANGLSCLAGLVWALR